MKKKLDASYTQNRELSWLRFNERVLEEAADPTVPLFERFKLPLCYFFVKKVMADFQTKVTITW